MRLIDADELIVMEYGGIRFVPAEFINDAPTIDAVQVVRCKDCRWYEIAELNADGTEDKRFKPSLCVLQNRTMDKDYFCADGERRSE